MELSQIHSSSPAFSQLEYDLQSLSKASTLRITQAWEISNPNLTVQFDRKSKHLLILDSWMNVQMLKAPNLESDVIKRGFQGNCLVFPMGKVNMSNNTAALESLSSSMLSQESQTSHSNNSGKIRKRMICCKVAVGRAFCAVDLATSNEAIPEGYDSFYLDPSHEEYTSSKSSNNSFASPLNLLENLDFCGEQNINSSLSLQFAVKDSCQVLPRFIVECEFDPKAEKQSRQKSTCENCESALATVYCQADAAHLCSRCDTEIHKSKLTSRHARMSLEKGPQCVVSCRIHPERMAEFFCPSCHVLVCLNCKMIGHHSTGEAVKHPLVSVTEAYASVMESSHAPDPLMEDRRTNLKSQLQKIHKRGQNILQNAKIVREQIEDIYKRAINDLNSVVYKRLLVLKSDAQEYKRLLSEMQRIRDYLDYLETGRDATLFLLSWHQYLHAKADLPLLPSSGKDNQSNELPLHVTGSLTVQCEIASSQRSSGSNHGPHPSVQLAHIAKESTLTIPAMNASAASISILNAHQPVTSSTLSSPPRNSSQVQASGNATPAYRLSSNQSSHSVNNNSNHPNRSKFVPANESHFKKATDMFTEALQTLDLGHPMTS